MIEKKKEVFPGIHDFHDGLAASFKHHGLEKLGDIIGELIPGNKNRVPLQAADLLCWHTQRKIASVKNPSISFTTVDQDRLNKLSQYGIGSSITKEMVSELCGGLFEDRRKLNEGTTEQSRV